MAVFCLVVVLYTNNFIIFFFIKNVIFQFFGKVSRREYFTVPGLEPSTSYTAAVRAFNKDTSSDKTELEFMTKSMLSILDIQGLKNAVGYYQYYPIDFLSLNLSICFC